MSGVSRLNWTDFDGGCDEDLCRSPEPDGENARGVFRPKPWDVSQIRSVAAQIIAEWLSPTLLGSTILVNGDTSSIEEWLSTHILIPSPCIAPGWCIRVCRCLRVSALCAWRNIWVLLRCVAVVRVNLLAWLSWLPWLLRELCRIISRRRGISTGRGWRELVG